MKDCRCALVTPLKKCRDELLRMLRSAADCGHDHVPKASKTSRLCCHRPSASWLHGLTGAWHCISGTSALELPGRHRAGAEQARGLSLFLHEWARNCLCCKEQYWGLCRHWLGWGEAAAFTDPALWACINPGKGLGMEGLYGAKYPARTQRRKQHLASGVMFTPKAYGTFLFPFCTSHPCHYPACSVPELSWHQAQVFW